MAKAEWNTELLCDSCAKDVPRMSDFCIICMTDKEQIESLVPHANQYKYCVHHQNVLLLFTNNRSRG